MPYYASLIIQREDQIQTNNSKKIGMYEVLKVQRIEDLIVPWVFWYTEQSRNQVASIQQKIISRDIKSKFIHTTFITKSVSLSYRIYHILYAILPYIIFYMQYCHIAYRITVRTK